MELKKVDNICSNCYELVISFKDGDNTDIKIMKYSVEDKDILKGDIKKLKTISKMLLRYSTLVDVLDDYHFNVSAYSEEEIDAVEEFYSKLGDITGLNLLLEENMYMYTYMELEGVYYYDRLGTKYEVNYDEGWD